MCYDLPVLLLFLCLLFTGDGIILASVIFYLGRRDVTSGWRCRNYDRDAPNI